MISKIFYFGIILAVVIHQLLRLYSEATKNAQKHVINI